MLFYFLGYSLCIFVYLSMYFVDIIYEIILIREVSFGINNENLIFFVISLYRMEDIMRGIRVFYLIFSKL